MQSVCWDASKCAGSCLCSDVPPWENGMGTCMHNGARSSNLVRTTVSAVMGCVCRGRKIAMDVARGLDKMHSRHIIHLDLKSPNVLLTAGGTAKIAVREPFIAFSHRGSRCNVTHTYYPMWLSVMSCDVVKTTSSCQMASHPAKIAVRRRLLFSVTGVQNQVLLSVSAVLSLHAFSAGGVCKQAAGKGYRDSVPCRTRQIQARRDQPWARRSAFAPLFSGGQLLHTINHQCVAVNLGGRQSCSAARCIVLSRTCGISDECMCICAQDVGLSKILVNESTMMTNFQGTFEWAPPELINGGECSEKADIYSFGVILWEIVTAERPFRKQFRTPRHGPRFCPSFINWT